MKNSKWGSGPWDEEPDSIEWVDERSGFHCLIRRNSTLRTLLGYVGLPPTNIYWGLSHNQIFDLHPHGGVTYSGIIEGYGHTWFLGFDCGCISDHNPSAYSLSSPGVVKIRGVEVCITYKDVKFVETVILNLIGQIKNW